MLNKIKEVYKTEEGKKLILDIINTPNFLEEILATYPKVPDIGIFNVNEFLKDSIPDINNYKFQTNHSEIQNNLTKTKLDLFKKELNYMYSVLEKNKW